MDSENIVYFDQINLAFLAGCRYEIEKCRLRVRKIKVGGALVDEFQSFVDKEHGNHFLTGYIKIVGTVGLNGCVKIGGATVETSSYGACTYYMEPNEILFLSERDDIYVRARKREPDDTSMSVPECDELVKEMIVKRIVDPKLHVSFAAIMKKVFEFRDLKLKGEKQ